MGLTRRDFFTLGLGAAAALPLTPAPWKLLDDTSKWSQNWSWIPRPPSGERSVRYSTCTLCPAGCGITARCAGKNTTGIAPVAGHPVSKGVLCPYAFGAHQLPYHPARLTEPLRNGVADSLGRISAEIAARVNAGTMAILDERPGRAVSAAYQKIALSRGGQYLTPARSESATLRQIAKGAGIAISRLGFAIEDVRTIVSFGAPMLESWATPGRVLTPWRDRRLSIVQIEPKLSKTAALASMWISAEGITPQVAEAIETIRSRGPMLAVSGGGLSEADELAVAQLNRGSRAIVRRDSGLSIAATELQDAPAESIDVLFIDHGYLGGSVAMEAVRPKLRRDAIIVSLSPYRAGIAAAAHYTIPSPAFGESLDEAGTPWDAATPSYSLAPVLGGDAKWRDPSVSVCQQHDWRKCVAGYGAARACREVACGEARRSLQLRFSHETGNSRFQNVRRSLESAFSRRMLDR